MLLERTVHQTYLHLPSQKGQNMNYQKVESVFAKKIKITIAFFQTTERAVK